MDGVGSVVALLWMSPVRKRTITLAFAKVLYAVDKCCSMGMPLPKGRSRIVDQFFCAMVKVVV